MGGDGDGDGVELRLLVCGGVGVGGVADGVASSVGLWDRLPGDQDRVSVKSMLRVPEPESVSVCVKEGGEGVAVGLKDPRLLDGVPVRECDGEGDWVVLNRALRVGDCEALRLIE